ncbi:MAG: DUF5752 family protein [Candidatus Micrarchaeota archaeon]|nr:DUF5752 family protein [Candidatus Micrarchaeota archaeon]
MAKKKEEHNASAGKEFVFVRPGQGVAAKARNLSEFRDCIAKVPLESLLYHANGGHFKGWLEFIGQKGLAEKVAGVKGNDEGVRGKLLSLL